MKKLLLAAVAAAAVAVQAETKIGVVDMVLLVKNHPNYEPNKELLSSTDKDYQKKLEVLKAEGEKLQSEGKQLAEQLRSPMLADKAKGDIEKKLMDLQQKLISAEQRYRGEAMRFGQDLQDLEGRLLSATTTDLRRRIAKFADDKDFAIILDKQAVPFVEKSMDVTDDVLEAMGVNPKDAKGRDEGK